MNAIKSNFAILDVKSGRKSLKKLFYKTDSFGQVLPVRIPVTIKGYIDGVWGDDDGISQEFSVSVQSVKQTSR